MKRILTLITLLYAAALMPQQLSAQACSPDSTLGNLPGLYPDTLANATIGEFFEQQINIILPEDTTLAVSGIGEFSFDICAFKIDSIPNLPAGMDFACNAPDCNFTVDLSDADSVIRACIVISGTPETAVLPNDTLLVALSVELGTYNATTEACDPLALTLPPELTSQTLATRWIVTSATTSIAKNFADQLDLRIAPNPSTSFSRVSFELQESKNIQIQLIDLLGRRIQEVHDGNLAPGEQSFELITNTLKSGVYFLIFKEKGQFLTQRKLIVY